MIKEIQSISDGRLFIWNFSIPFTNFNLLQHKNIDDIFIRLEVSKLDKSKYFNSLHKLNINDISLTFFVLNLIIPSIFFNFLHPENINDISVTLEVLKLDRFKNSNSLQARNIIFIELTLVVIKLFIPFISFNLEHPEKISDIFVTLEVLKFDKSNELNLLQL